MQRINGEIEALRIAARFDGTRKQFMESITADPAGTVTTEQALVAAFVAMKATVQPRLPELFSRFPKADFEVRPIEKFRENAASSQYVPATPDGSRPGVFYVNAARLRSGPQRPSESLFLHEAIPGHHFQVALTSENQALPADAALRALQRLRGGLGALLRGVRTPSWGCTGTSRSRREGSGASCSARCASCWTPECTTRAGHGSARSTTPREQGSGTSGFLLLEVDRYLADPGQALGYKIGELAIRKMREEAEHRLGSAFDLRAFHDAILESGPLPLDVLEGKMHTWNPPAR